MARPKADRQAITQRILDEAERLLRESRGRRLVLSDIASRLDISQSYVHRFFPTKADLVRALAERWFEAVEQESRSVLEGDYPADQRLEAWVLAILQTKRQAHDEDPELFNAYLELASQHMDVVLAHVNHLQADLKTILAQLVPAEKMQAAVTLTEDATLMFRTPHNIARHRQSATDERAKAVVKMLLRHFAAA